jgi:hypothetical protein
LIKQISLERSLISWSDVVERGLSRGQIAGVVPGALRYYDLPDLAARLSPRLLTVLNPTNALGLPCTQMELEEAYSKCIKAYGNQGSLVLRAKP